MNHSRSPTAGTPWLEANTRSDTDLRRSCAVLIAKRSVTNGVDAGSSVIMSHCLTPPYCPAFQLLHWLAEGHHGAACLGIADGWKEPSNAKNSTGYVEALAKLLTAVLPPAAAVATPAVPDAVMERLQQGQLGQGSYNWGSTSVEASCIGIVAADFAPEGSSAAGGRGEAVAAGGRAEAGGARLSAVAFKIGPSALDDVTMADPFPPRSDAVRLLITGRQRKQQRTANLPSIATASLRLEGDEGSPLPRGVNELGPEFLLGLLDGLCSAAALGIKAVNRCSAQDLLSDVASAETAGSPLLPSPVVIEVQFKPLGGSDSTSNKPPAHHSAPPATAYDDDEKDEKEVWVKELCRRESIEQMRVQMHLVHEVHRVSGCNVSPACSKNSFDVTPPT